MKNYLKKQGYNVLSDTFYNTIEMWESWYKGKVKSFHRYTQYNGKKQILRERASLCMAKRVCEDWANLILNERFEINVNDKKADLCLKKVLLDNDFFVLSNRLVELTFALGTGAFVEYLANGEVVIDYIRADMIYPLSWDNGKITECAFASEKVINGKAHIYLNMHILKDGHYKIINKLFEKNGAKLVEVNLPDGIAKSIDTGYKKPFFQIITPNIINNIDFDNPMGISVFANSIDILKGIDLIYDSYQNEFRLGKKRIIVPLGMAQMMSEETGVMPVFDDNDTEFYAIKESDGITEIKEINMNIRADEHEAALKRNINLLSENAGLGVGRYEKTHDEIKTATEVISEKSNLYQNIKKNELIVEKALIDLAEVILYLKGFENKVVSVYFGDSIIEDTQSVFNRAMEEFKNGIITKDEYLNKVYNLNKEVSDKKE
ncbi:MAG: phage portal protein [Ruminococcaceae bacterium]|nr:phage portal protein [Oscillospiraceae bacterium]